MVSKPAGLSLAVQSSTQFSHEPLAIADVLPSVLARYGAQEGAEQRRPASVRLSQAELDARYFEQQQRRSCSGCGEGECF